MIAVSFATGPAPSAALAAGVDREGRLSAALRHDPSARALALRAPSLPRFSGDEGGFGECLSAFRPNGWLTLLGTGGDDNRTLVDLRRLGGRLFVHLAQAGGAAVSVMLDFPPEQLAEIAFGMRIRSWRIDPGYRKNHPPEEARTLKKAIFVTPDPERAEDCYKKLAAVADGMDFARDLTVAPANLLTPAIFARRLRELREFGVDVDMIDAKELKALGLNLLLAVGQASETPPRLALLQWRGAKASKKPLMLVGKGITFDTGGIDVKPALRMEEMKGDMAGAATVAGVLLAAAKGKLPDNLVGVLAIAENSLSGDALRPGDVIRSHSGKTVEIADTDAEGRLVLADALSYGAKRFSPRMIVDLATLTGSVVVALGRGKAGLFSNDDALAARLLSAGEQEGDCFWRMPLTDRYDDALKSEIADLRNCTWETPAPDSLHAARFLEHFVPEGVPWAHLDIAGVSETDEEQALFAKGPTGFGVRSLIRLILSAKDQDPA